MKKYYCPFAKNECMTYGCGLYSPFYESCSFLLIAEGMKEISIIEDKEAERQSDRQDVAMGAMPLWEYRSKYYAETEEQAKKNVQQPEETVIE